jgi:hypothetical protein
MAALTQDQCRRVFTDTGPRQWSLFGLYAVSTGDTIDMAALTYFRLCTKAIVMGCTGAGAAAPAQVSGAVITLPANLSNDSAYLLVDGIPL